MLLLLSTQAATVLFIPSLGDNCQLEASHEPNENVQNAFRATNEEVPLYLLGLAKIFP